jgi:hypothetical protein
MISGGGASKGGKGVSGGEPVPASLFGKAGDGSESGERAAGRK